MGSTPTIPGSLDGFFTPAIVPLQAAFFAEANSLLSVTFRVTDALVGGDVTIELNTEQDGTGNGISATILAGATFATASGVAEIAAGGALYQRITALTTDPFTALNLSGDYVVQTSSGAMAQLTSLSLIKIHADITSSTYDTLLSFLLAGVSSAMQSHMKRKIIQAIATGEKTEVAAGGRIVTLDHYPVVSITSITESGVALVEDTDFEAGESDLLSGNVVRISGGDAVAWASGTRNIVATYVHGYAVVPPDLELAATLQVRQEFLQTKQGGDRVGDTSKSTQSGGVVGYQPAEWLPMVLLAMAPYRRDVMGSF